MSTIDYGMDLTNVDHETGIHYGVIPANDVMQAWSDSSEPEYDCDECEAKQEFESDPENEGEEFDCSDYECEPRGFAFVEDGYEACQSRDDSDIFITKSPFYTFAAFCSPCAPGAGHLRNPLAPDEGVKTYCFGDDWFEDESCPYTIYNVVDDAIVYQPKGKGRK